MYSVLKCTLSVVFVTRGTDITYQLVISFQLSAAEMICQESVLSVYVARSGKLKRFVVREVVVEKVSQVENE